MSCRGSLVGGPRVWGGEIGNQEDVDEVLDSSAVLFLWSVGPSSSPEASNGVNSWIAPLPAPAFAQSPTRWRLSRELPL